MLNIYSQMSALFAALAQLPGAPSINLLALAMTDNFHPVPLVASAYDAAGNPVANLSPPFQAFDGNETTKWFTNAMQTAASPIRLELDLGVDNSAIVKTYKVMVDDRNNAPKQWVLEGGDPLKQTWTPLDSQQLGSQYVYQPDGGIFGSGIFTVANPMAYRAYRLSVQSSFAAMFCQINRLVFNQTP